MYFTEFEFCFWDAPEAVYWLPVLINTKDLQNAQSVKDSIIGTLTKKFRLLRTGDLKKYETPLYPSTLKPLVATQQKVQILKLNLKALTIASFEQEIGVKLASEYQIIPQMLLTGYRHTITNKLKRFGFLTTQIHNEPDYEKEFLVMKFKAYETL